MTKTITITAFNRPAYLETVLNSLLQNDLSGWTILIGLEPSHVRQDMIELIERLLSSRADFKIRLNETQLGVRGNPHSIMSYAFELGADLNIYLEDDTVVSPDVTQLALWYGSQELKGVVCLNLMYGSCGGKNHVSIDIPESMLLTRQFNSLGFIITRRQWESYFRDYWFNDDHGWRHAAGAPVEGWDWAIMLHHLSNTPHQFTLQPLLPRANHIGREGGTYCDATFHDSTFADLKMSDRADSIDYRIAGVA